MDGSLTAFWTADGLAVNGVLVAHAGFAFLLGLAIGYERTYHGHAAGMRTYSLVATASAALVAAIAYPGHWYGGLADAPLPDADPTRVIQGLVTGIGFLGAGVILKEGFSIRGLSTAAAIWVTAAIGTLCGLGFLLAAGIITVMTVAAMALLRPLEDHLPHQVNLHLELDFEADKAPLPTDLQARIAALGCRPVAATYRFDRSAGRMSYTLQIRTSATDPATSLIAAFADAEGLTALRLSPNRN